MNLQRQQKQPQKQHHHRQTLKMSSLTKTPPAASKQTYPCTECRFEAQSARQLSRHKAVTHTQNALKCVLCPFVTAYQTNLLRHRKDVHGICGSKGNKSCKFCGFVSEDNDTLIHHQIEFHQDILKSAQVKFAKELVSAGGDESIADFSANFESMSEELFNGRGPPSSFQLNLAKKPKGNKKAKMMHEFHHHAGGGMSGANVHGGSVNHNNGVAEANNEFDDFWKAGFMDNNYADHQPIYFHSASAGNVDSQNESVNTSRSSTPKSQVSHGNKDNLPATRIRRQYTCNDCGIRTVNPREFLYHRRDGHGHKIKIVECPYCVYACQYVQKLQRHLLLVHKLSAMVTPSGEPIINGDSESMVLKRKYKKFKHDFDGSSLLDNDISNSNFEPDITMEDDNDSLNDEDFEQMNNFEMNLNEYENNNGQEEEEESDNADMDKEEATYPINLECTLCKIQFGDIVSAQKHFLKNHKYSDSKNILNFKHGSSPILMTTSQRKVFDDLKNVHSCNYCGYKTRWISELERHVRVHSKEKPFKCAFCDFKSKWKGDLNRHVQRYHGSTLAPDGESDASANGATGNSHNSDVSPTAAGSSHQQQQQQTDGSLNHPKGSFRSTEANDEYANSYEGSADEHEMLVTSRNGVEQHQNNSSTDNFDNEDSVQSPNGSSGGGGGGGGGGGNSAKMYKCTYCDFMCSTASRFHVHYVQHLNTKPFQCSICGHRSNWEWDVTKHIKMKAQRDPNHAKAHPVLIHDSGKRDYSKYNKFVVWVGQAEAEMANNEANKIDFRAKRFRTEVEEPETPEENLAIDNILMPEVCFEEVDGEGTGYSSANSPGEQGSFADNHSPSKSKNGTFASSSSCTSIFGSPSIVKSVIVSRHGNSRNQLIYCNECDFKHQFARVLVAHLASHSEGKPYACKHCPFESNWREVLINHNRTEHMRTDPLDFEMRFRCVIDENSICRIISLEELSKMEVETANAEALEAASAAAAAAAATAIETNSSLIEPNLYEEKAVIRCELCPFLTTNLKKMTIHCRFHNSSKGSLKCKFCPYFVNNKEKLLRHQKLHQKQSMPSSASSHPHSNFAHAHNLSKDRSSHFRASTFGRQQHHQTTATTLISCSFCSFRAGSIQVLNEHMKVHEQDAANVEYGGQDFNESLLDQSMEEKPVFFGEAGSNTNTNAHHEQQGNDYAENSVSLIDVNNMKNGTAKKFSYVCPDCPAAFKSPGDYKIHAVFHSSNYQHSCPYCTYKARNKPQLCKHLYVHTAEYIAKRANSYPDGTKHLVGSQDNHGSAQEITFPAAPKKMNFAKQPPKVIKARKHRTKIAFPMKPVKVKLNSEENGKQKIVFNNTDLMASQEFLETKEYLQRINSGIKNRCMYRCSTCPAVFTKVNTLIYHMTLHDTKSEFTCESCTYSTTSDDNLSIHSLLHNLTESQAALGYNFNYNCHKCPAGFSKRTRLEKHFSLHGAKFNWKCDKCDYSVRYAATLVKHRALHLINPNFRVTEKASAVDGELIVANSLSLVKGRSNGAATNDDDAEQLLDIDPSDLAIDEENSRDDDEMPPAEDEEAEDAESFDGIPPEVMLEEEDEEVEAEADDDDDDEGASLNDLVIET